MCVCVLPLDGSMLIRLLLMISLNHQLVSVQIHLDLLWFEVRDVNGNGELLRRILHLNTVIIRLGNGWYGDT